MEQRWCPRCKETKSLSEYYILKSGSRAGRVQGWCKFCQNRQRKESLASDPVRKALKKKRDSTYHTKYYQANRERILEQNRAWRLANRDTLRLSQRARYLLDTYGLSLEQYGVMFEAQKGVCALCGEVDQHGNRLAVDHCHKTDKVRGLLCTLCNRAIGLVRDDPDVAERMAHYLRGNHKPYSTKRKGRINFKS